MVSNLLYDVVLHLGTLIALLIFFYQDISKYIIAFFQSFAKWQYHENTDQRVAWLLIIGTVPAAIIGFFLEDIITNYFRQPFWVAITLIVVALLFFIGEKLSSFTKNIVDLTWRNSLFIGLAQAVALIPGVSRSGITILAGLKIGLTREVAARFSFLLAIPIVLGAGLAKLLDLSSIAICPTELAVLISGLIASVITGYFCIKYFLKFLQKNTLIPFAIYRIILALAVLGYFYLLK